MTKHRGKIPGAIILRAVALARAGIAALLCVGAATCATAATSVNVVGLFPGKAVVVINGQAPRTLSIGDKTAEGVALTATTPANATFTIDGKKHTLEVGQAHVGKGPVERAEKSGSDSRTVTLAADGRGHFVALGQINGKSVQFLIDTGATSVSVPASFAESAGIDYRKGQRMFSQTANGVAVVYRVMFDSVTLGDVTVYQVEGVVHESRALDVALLGMSFLNRMEMRRDGASMTLTKRY
jgi:aspartyl protease family protein